PIFRRARHWRFGNRAAVQRLTKVQARRTASPMSTSKSAPCLSRDVLLDRMEAPLAQLCAEARKLRDEGHGAHISYSRKVFIPLTHLCRDVCAYCTFAKPPRR